MYRYNDLTALHLEITTKCNARCPMCLRNVCGGQTNPQLPLTELTLADAKTIFEPSFIRQLRRMYMCGNYGDPIAAQDTLDIFDYFRSENPTIHLALFTNGSAQSEDWWRRLAKTVNLVHLSVDGLEDTNGIYRRGTHFAVIERNIKAYRAAGGEFVWDYIVFRHNEHQLEEAKERAQAWGAKKINFKKTGRFFSNTKMQRKDQQPVLNRAGELEYYLEPPLNPLYQNQALRQEEALVEKYGSLENYLDLTPIDCKVIHEKSFYVSAEGHAFPCCWTANQLYPWYFPEKNSYMWNLVKALPEGLEGLNAKRHPLQSIIEGDFFQKILTESWGRKGIKDGKPKVCAKTCGKEFDPFRAQFELGEKRL